MSSGFWLLRRLSLPLLMILCPGCSDVDSSVFPANRKPDASASKATISPVEEDPLLAMRRARKMQEDAIVSSARVALRPVITALETYHRQYGRYPAALDNLVHESLLAKSPDLPPAELG